MNQTTAGDDTMTNYNPQPTFTPSAEENDDEMPYLVYFPDSGTELVEDVKTGSCSWTAHSGIAFATNVDDSQLGELQQLLSAFPYLERSGIKSKDEALNEASQLKDNLFRGDSEQQGMTAQIKLVEVFEEGLGVEVWGGDNADDVKDRRRNRFFYPKRRSLGGERSGMSSACQQHTTTSNNSSIPPSFLIEENRADRFSPPALASYKARQVQQLQGKRSVPDDDDDDYGQGRDPKRRGGDICNGVRTVTEYLQQPFEQMEEMSDV